MWMESGLEFVRELLLGKVRNGEEEVCGEL